MSPPAARVGDFHGCPMMSGIVPHVGGPIAAPGCPTVLIGGIPAARVGDMAVCAEAPDTIVRGAPTVIIGGAPAARIGHQTAHGGVIIAGDPSVLIGDGSGPPRGIRPGAALSAAAQAVNPTGSVVNCGNIIDAVVVRLRGTDPDATAPAQGDGSFRDIERRFGTKFQWG